VIPSSDDEGNHQEEDWKPNKEPPNLKIRNSIAGVHRAFVLALGVDILFLFQLLRIHHNTMNKQTAID
jgi:hypothetical protein